MKKIRPIQYAKPNQCKNCGGRLELIEEEVFISQLDSKGIPNKGDTFFSSRLRCIKCNAEFDAMKKGMHYAIASNVPPIPVIAKEYNPFYQ